MTTTIAPIEERRNLGIGILLFAQLFFATLDTSAKYLSFIGLPLSEIVFVRYAVHVMLALALFLPVLKGALFITRNWKLELLRGLFLLGVTGANFMAQRYLPLTVTGALMFTMPLMVTALSGPFLGEKIGWRRWMAVGIGFIGILIIVRPGTETFQPASLIALAGALSAAAYSITTRKLAGVDSSSTQQVYAGLIALDSLHAGKQQLTGNQAVILFDPLGQLDALLAVVLGGGQVVPLVADLGQAQMRLAGHRQRLIAKHLQGLPVGRGR